MRVNRCIFAALWVLSLVGISCFGGAVSYGFFFGMSLLPPVCLGYLACVYLRFKIYQEIGSRTMVCGRPESYYFILKNEDFFAYAGVGVRLFSDFSAVEDGPGEKEYELLPGEQRVFQTRLVCRYRGEYEVGVKEVVVTDFLRLFRLRYANPGMIKALVSPRVVSLPRLSSLGELTAVVRRQAWGRTEPDASVRDYVEGDSLKQIHWKASARTDSLKVRTRTGEEKQGISIFFDTARLCRDRQVYLPLENRILEVVLALVFFFAGKGIGVSVCYGKNGLAESRVEHMGEFEHFYREMDAVVFSEVEDRTTTLEQLAAGGRLWESRAFLLVLHEPDDGVTELTGRLGALGIPTVTYAVTDENMESHIRQSSERSRLVPVPLDGELEGIL